MDNVVRVEQEEDSIPKTNRNQQQQQRKQKNTANSSSSSSSTLMQSSSSERSGRSSTSSGDQQEFLANHRSGRGHIGDGDANSNNASPMSFNNNNNTSISISNSDFVSATEDSLTTTSDQQNNLNKSSSSSSSRGYDGISEVQNGNKSDLDQEKQGRNSDEDEDGQTMEEVTHASLIVNLSTDSSSVDFKEERVLSPLSSARSAPPDLSHGDGHGYGRTMIEDVLFSSTPKSAIRSQSQSAAASGAAPGPGGKAVKFQDDVATWFEHRGQEGAGHDDNYDIDDHMFNVLVNEDEAEARLLGGRNEGQSLNNSSTSPNSIVTAQTPIGQAAVANSNARQAVDFYSPLNQFGTYEISDAEIEAAQELSQELEFLEEDDSEVSAINSELAGPGLPVTVTKLKAPNGTDVYLVGTAHFSLESQNDVIKTIQQIRPRSVFIELCTARKHILHYDEETILREAQNLNFQKIRHIFQTSGPIQGALHLLLLSMSSNLTKKLGMAPGGEFRVASREAHAMSSQIVFGDRLFTVTLARALASLSLGQKVKLAWQFLTTNDDITKEEIERCKEKDILEQMLEEMTGEYPSISNVFVTERDIYLAHALWLTAMDANSEPVVGVVGMGHVPGMKKQWGKTTEAMFREINQMPKASLGSIIIRKTIKYGFYGLLAFGIYKVGHKVVRRLPLPEIPQSLANIKISTAGWLKKY